MKVEILRDEETQRISVRITGRFDFKNQRKFLDEVIPLFSDEALQHLKFDLSAVDYIDSGALGVLMLLREGRWPRGRVSACTVHPLWWRTF